MRHSPSQVADQTARGGWWWRRFYPAPTGATASGLTVNSSAPTIPSDGSGNVTITAFAKNDNNVLIANVNVCFKSSTGAVTVTNGVNGCVATNASSAGQAITCRGTAGSGRGRLPRCASSR